MKKIGLWVAFLPLLSTALGYGLTWMVSGNATVDSSSSLFQKVLVLLIFSLATLVWIVNAFYGVVSLVRYRMSEWLSFYYAIWFFLAIYLLVTKDRILSAHALYLFPILAILSEIQKKKDYY